VRELSTGRLDRLVIEVHDRHGSAAATTVRTVLSGMVGLAVRHDALRATLHEDEKCRDLDLVELTDVGLATGLRIGEATAVTWDALDLESGTVEVRGTVIRIKGSGDLACVPRDGRDADGRRRTLGPPGRGPARPLDDLDDAGLLLRAHGGRERDEGGPGGLRNDVDPRNPLVGVSWGSILSRYPGHFTDLGESSSDWTRTNNRPINSRVLCH
jgi:hypothetical protein